MSGRKQHYIPQSLLKGFGVVKKRKSVHVTVYSRDRGTYATATDGVAAERDFYSDPSEHSETLDDQITEFENSIGQRLLEYRQLQKTCGVNADEAAEFVTHLTVRAAHTRNTFGDGAGQVVEGIARRFEEPSAAWKLLELDRPHPSPSMRSGIEKALDKSLANWRANEEWLVDQAYQEIKRSMQDDRAVVTPVVQMFVASLQGHLPGMIRTGHNDALGRGLAPAERIAALSALRWEIRLADADSFILPDYLASATGHASKMRPLALTANPGLRSVWIPVAHDRILIGRRGSPSMPDWRALNVTAASWCSEIFIARSKTAELEALCPRIGAELGFWIADQGRSALATQSVGLSKR